MGVGGQRHAMANLFSVKTRYTWYRMLGGPQDRSRPVRKFSTGIRSPDRWALSESLYRLSYLGLPKLQNYSPESRGSQSNGNFSNMAASNSDLTSIICLQNVMIFFQLKRNAFTARYETNLDTKFMITFFFRLCPWTVLQSPLPLSFHQCCTLIFIYMLLLPEGQAGEVWEPSKKPSFVKNRGEMSRKGLSLFHPSEF